MQNQQTGTVLVHHEPNPDSLEVISTTVSLGLCLLDHIEPITSIICTALSMENDEWASIHTDSDRYGVRVFMLSKSSCTAQPSCKIKFSRANIK